MNTVLIQRTSITHTPHTHTYLTHTRYIHDTHTPHTHSPHTHTHTSHTHHTHTVYNLLIYLYSWVSVITFAIQSFVFEATSNKKIDAFHILSVTWWFMAHARLGASVCRLTGWLSPKHGRLVSMQFAIYADPWNMHKNSLAHVLFSSSRKKLRISSFLRRAATVFLLWLYDIYICWLIASIISWECNINISLIGFTYV